MRLDVLRQKDETNQSAVARCLILLIFNLIVLYFDLILTKRDEKHLSFLSPEVKRRLQEVILQRKRKEAASSMGNLQVIIQNNQTEEQTNKENKQNSQTNKQPNNQGSFLGLYSCFISTPCSHGPPEKGSHML